MLPEIFVNELSLSPASNVATAQARAQEFILAIQAAVGRGMPRNLRIPEDFSVRQLAPAYYWRDLLDDKRVDLDLRRYFRSLATKSPFLRGLAEMDAAYAEIDCYFHSHKTLGLKAAYTADGLAVSLATQEAWDCSLILCEIHELVDEDVSVRTEAVRHASSTLHVETHTDWIHTRMQTAVENGKQLLQLRGEFFPMLYWCDEVGKQMEKLEGVSLPSIVRGLFRLNVFCLAWREGAFDPDRIECDISPESEPTLSMFGKQREFSCPNGERRVFSWHAKVGHWRIYFDPDVGPGKLLIGYVGKHLQTTKFK